jgi:hypothetical protein
MRPSIVAASKRRVRPSTADKLEALSEWDLPRLYLLDRHSRPLAGKL